MVRGKMSCGVFCALLLAASMGQAGIINVIETNLGGDDAAIYEPAGPGAVGVVFGEDALTFSDRTHQHNGAAFDDAGTASTLRSAPADFRCGASRPPCNALPKERGPCQPQERLVRLD